MSGSREGCPPGEERAQPGGGKKPSRRLREPGKEAVPKGARGQEKESQAERRCPLCLAKERSLVMAETESEVWRAGEKIGWGEAEGGIHDPLLHILPQWQVLTT